MEQYFPFIIAGGYFAYKIYTNFQKMQEEAKKRNPAVPHDGKAVEKTKGKGPLPSTFPKPSSSGPLKPAPFLVQEVDDSKHAEPTYKSVYEQPLHEKRAAKNKTSRPAKSGIPTRIKLSDKIIHDDVPEEIFHFDMRQAVINQAILERPQY
ncbi:hypothetical protein [Arcticibacter eurypsychrophilus]|uniref:hypothetical protein n=1 Tax=Arcticibacter eurypsychrophilus TaxID=1434752 RepID=UPI00084D712C|nr:hypothetical protein [Arcticibacter eurypsychrophilus]